MFYDQQSADGVVVSVETLQEASGSAIKGIRLVPSTAVPGEVQLVSVGYDQRLSEWKGSLDSKQKYTLEWCNGAPVNVSDVGGLDIGYLPVTGQPICCVVGEGVQLFSL